MKIKSGVEFLKLVMSGLLNLLEYLYGAIMILILIVCLFFSEISYACKKNLEYANWQYMLLGSCIIGFLFGIIFLLERSNIKIKYHKWYMVGLNVLFFLVLVLSAYHYYFKTGWDVGTVTGTAHLLALGKVEEAQTLYFSYFPNNILLTFIFSVIIKIGYTVGISNYYFVIITFQCFLFAVAGILIYCIAEKLLNGIWAFGIWGLYVAFVGVSPWVVVPYSDATGMIFPIAIFYVYQCIRDKKCIQGNLLLLTFLSYIGYKIKPQIIIMLIALVIVSLLEWGRDFTQLKKRWLSKAVWAVAGLLLSMGIVTLCINATRMEIENEWTFGVPHFLMMGMNEDADGMINQEDQEFSMSIPDRQERNRQALNITLERIKGMGTSGLLKLLERKLLVNFSDGTFAWWEEGSFYAQEMYDGNYLLRSILTNYYYEHGANYNSFLNYMQMLWMGILFYTMIAFKAKKNRNHICVLMLSIIGLVVFELLFEARARYLFTYVPIFVLLAGVGAYYMMHQKRREADYE